MIMNFSSLQWMILTITYKVTCQACLLELGGSMPEWSACRTSNPAVPSSYPVATILDSRSSWNSGRYFENNPLVAYCQLKLLIMLCFIGLFPLDYSVINGVPESQPKKLVAPPQWTKFYLSLFPVKVRLQAADNHKELL